MLSDEPVTRIKSKSLTSVNFSCCKKISDRAFCSFANNNPNLKICKIDGTKLKNKSLYSLGRSCSGLNMLSAAMCPSIGDRGISELASYCSDLLSLDIHGTNLTDIGLRVIAESCPLLKHINLANTKRISDDGIGLLAENCPKLQSIDVSENSCSSNITDTSLHMLAAHCDSLQDINFSDCDKISNKGVIAIIEKCISTKKIYLSNCKRIDGKAIREIGRVVAHIGRENLKLVNIRHNKLINLEDAIAFKRCCPYVLLGEDWYDRGMDLEHASRRT